MDDLEVCDLWFWNGRLETALAEVAGCEDHWLLEKGILIRENDQLDCIRELILGDVVYRLRTSRGLELNDPRDRCFEWHLVDPYTGEAQGRAWASAQDQ
jgi:hypothetical protein